MFQERDGEREMADKDLNSVCETFFEGKRCMWLSVPEDGGEIICCLLLGILLCVCLLVFPPSPERAATQRHKCRQLISTLNKASVHVWDSTALCMQSLTQTGPPC